MIKKLFTITLLVFILSGCGSLPFSQNSIDYRKDMAKGAFGSRVEIYEVDVPYDKVAKTLKTKGKECLTYSGIQTTCYNSNCTGGAKREIVYRPTIISNSTKTEIHVQWKRTPWDMLFGGKQPPPESGMYIALMDAVPAGKNKTKITLYGPSFDHLQTIPNALKQWADQSSLGCPDLTQAMYY